MYENDWEDWRTNVVDNSIEAIEARIHIALVEVSPDPVRLTVMAEAIVAELARIHERIDTVETELRARLNLLESDF